MMFLACRRSTFGICVTLCATLVVCGCRSEPSSEPEMSLREELVAVQQGRQDSIQIQYALVGDRELAEIRDCDRLQELLIERSTISDAGVLQLNHLPALRHRQTP